MLKNELLQIMRAAAQGRRSSTNFSDTQSAAKNAMIEHFGLEDMSIRDIRLHSTSIFAVLEQVVQEVLPAEIEARIGDFAEIGSFGRDETVKFTIDQVGKRRIVNGIVKGARGGIYKARRLDSREFMLPTEVWTVGYRITLEELLTGKRTVSELVQIIADGFVEKTYKQVIMALRAAYVNAPDANTANGNGIDFTALDDIIAIISAYGSPLLIGFQQAMAKLNNGAAWTQPVTANPNLPTQDLDELRSRGVVSMYKSTPVVVIPNYLVDETNAKWVFKVQDIFILPTDAKPVKIALKGDIYTAEVQEPHGGKEYHAHRMMGVGIVYNNNIGVYKDDDLVNIGEY